MNKLVIAINDPQDGVLISTASFPYALEAIRYTKDHMSSLNALGIEYGISIEFEDGTSAVWNKGQQSECLK